VIVYIWGNLTIDNFTPRPGKDTVGKPGQAAGLSASDAIPPGRKAQGVDTEKLKQQLIAIADDVSHGGLTGHFSIAPVGDDGRVDMLQLEDWANARGSGASHPLTQILLDAVVLPNVKGDVQ